jgi:hypothetical protein
MKKIIVVIFIISQTSFFAQELTYDNFKSIIPFLKTEDYKGAFIRTEELLNYTKSDTTDLRAQVSYMNIYSSAGMVTLKQMSSSDFEKNLKKFIGKKLKMPGHPCLDSIVKAAFNSFQFIKKEDKELHGYTMTANKEKVNILLFEYYNFKEKYNPEDFIGSNVRCSGILESFEVNPSKSLIWIGRLHISNAVVKRFIPN